MMTEISITTGTVDFQVDGKKFETWYKVFGDLKSKHRPVVALHGGPGLTHDYMLCASSFFSYETSLSFVALARNYSLRPSRILLVAQDFQHSYHLFRIPVLFYDQIGNGNSSHYRDAPKEFWTPELFMDELDNILQKLGIYEDFDLLGHSWGGPFISFKK